ncbi:MAG: ABC transporter permease [Limnochordia bacterium]|jgi:fluoroquinolone transport system permease protein|nr:ABC transporter permease [Bacillota bacterium]
MRLWALLRGDVRFQYKYGFYFLYMFLALLYIGMLSVFPDGWRERAAILMIFSDPAAMGLYFMGAIVLLEKSERTLDSIAVSPARTHEYTLSKLFSIGVISVIVGLTIGLVGGAVKITIQFLVGLLLCSCLFSAVGLVIVARSVSLNSFIISTVPVQLLINLPAAAWLFGWQPSWLLLHPGVSMMQLCMPNRPVLPSGVILASWTLAAWVIANRTVAGMFKQIGGVKL